MDLNDYEAALLSQTTFAQVDVGRCTSREVNLHFCNFVATALNMYINIELRIIISKW